MANGLKQETVARLLEAQKLYDEAGVKRSKADKIMKECEDELKGYMEKKGPGEHKSNGAVLTVVMSKATLKWRACIDFFKTKVAASVAAKEKTFYSTPVAKLKKIETEEEFKNKDN